jgi:hypothetical protein
MKKSVSTDLTPENIASVLGLLEATPDRLRAFRRSLAKEQQRQPLGRGERSFAEDVAHLVNCESRSSEAIYLALLANEPLLVDIHPERQFGKLLRFDRLPVDDLLSCFMIRRTVLLGVLGPLKKKDWARSVRQPGKQRRESVYWRARGIAVHEVEHLADLEAKLARARSAA